MYQIEESIFQKKMFLNGFTNGLKMKSLMLRIFNLKQLIFSQKFQGMSILTKQLNFNIAITKQLLTKLFVSNKPSSTMLLSQTMLNYLTATIGWITLRLFTVP